MARKAVLALVGTLDTKGEEYAFVKNEALRCGVDVLVIDTSVLGEPSFKAEITAEEVAKAAAVKLEDFRKNIEGDTRVHANKAMSRGLIDFTLPELLNHIHKGIFDAGPDRMNAAVRKAIPQVVSLGAIECFNFAAPETVPEKYRTAERKIILHNPNITSLLATPDELIALAEYVAEHLNRAAQNSLVALMMPLKGLDKYMAEGGPWFGAEYLKPLFDTLREKLDPSVELVEKDNHLNDRAFAEATAEKFLEIWAKKN